MSETITAAEREHRLRLFADQLEIHANGARSREDWRFSITVELADILVSILRAPTSPVGEPVDAIQWHGSNLAECKAWLGDDFGYDKGKVFFDMGLVMVHGYDDRGGYGDWIVRVNGYYYVVDGALYDALYRAAPTSQPEPTGCAWCGLALAAHTEHDRKQHQRFWQEQFSATSQPIGDVSK